MPLTPRRLTSDQSDEDILAEAATRLHDAEPLVAELTERGAAEDLTAILAEYVSEGRFLEAYLTDCAIRVLERDAGVEEEEDADDVDDVDDGDEDYDDKDRDDERDGS